MTDTDRPLAAVVLAAGQGKRMRAPGPKVLVRACGRTLVEHVLEALRPLGARPVVVVHGHGGNAVREALAGRDVRFAHQRRQLGTGDAVRCALPQLDNGFVGDVLVVCGDTPLLTGEVLAGLVADHRAAGRALSVLSAELDEPGQLGRVLRDPSGELRAIREAADATPGERDVREINTGVMIFDVARLGPVLERLSPENAQGELYLTDTPGLLLADGERVGAYRTDDTGAALGVNDPRELAAAVLVLRRRCRERAMASGAWFEDPATTLIDAGVEIGAGTRLLPFTWIGAGVRIGAGCTIGPFASLRDGVVVGDNVTLGTRVEVRAATIEDGVEVPGPARLVGAAVGRGARLGPGTRTEDEERGRVVIGEGAHVGAGVVLRAPVTVGEGARVEAGSVLSRGASAPEGGESHGA